MQTAQNAPNRDEDEDTYEDFQAAVHETLKDARAASKRLAEKFSGLTADALAEKVREAEASLADMRALADEGAQLADKADREFRDAPSPDAHSRSAVARQVATNLRHEAEARGAELAELQTEQHRRSKLRRLAELEPAANGEALLDRVHARYRAVITDARDRLEKETQHLAAELATYNAACAEAAAIERELGGESYGRMPMQMVGAVTELRARLRQELGARAVVLDLVEGIGDRQDVILTIRARFEGGAPR